jgi:outer membrane protein OmpA-like peptidoglycan-associated protein
MRSAKRYYGLSLAAGLLVLGSLGCATRGYVRSQVRSVSDEMNGRITQVQDDLTQVRNSSDQALARANAAFGSADSARDLALGKTGFRVDDQATVYFRFDSARLGDDARAALDSLTTRIEDTPQLLIDVYGFADRVGSTRYNYDLGQRRADAVLRYLTEKTPGQLARYAAVSYGKDQASLKGDREQRARDRKVVVSLVERTAPGSGQAPQASASPAGEDQSTTR